MFTTGIRLILLFHFATADPAVVFERARAALAAGDAAKASPLFEEAVSLSPKRAEYHDWLARSYMLEAKQSANAVRLAFLGWNIGTELEEAIRLDPSLNDVRVRLVEYYTMTPRIVGGSPAKAKQQARELAKRDIALGAWADGYIAYRAKQYGPARKSLQKAVESARDAKTKLLARTWLGWLSQETQQYETAFETWRAILEGDPSQTFALYEIGRTAQFCHCRLDEGEADLKRYLELNPKDEDAKKVLEKLRP